MKVCLLPILICLAFAACKSKDSAGSGASSQVPSGPRLCESPNWAGKMKVAVIIYNGVEAVDMNGPIDVFTKADYIKDHYFVYTVAAKDTLVFTENCYTAIMPRYTIHNCPSPDIIVLPGCSSSVLDKVLADTVFNNTILKWVKDMGTDKEKEVLAVCTGGILLGKTGLLDGRVATTHYLALGQMQQLCPKVKVIGGVRFVDTLNTVTTAGVTSSIDGALHLIEKYEGRVVADSVAHIMVYNRSCPMRDPSN